MFSLNGFCLCTIWVWAGMSFEWVLGKVAVLHFSPQEWVLHVLQVESVNGCMHVTGIIHCVISASVEVTLQIVFSVSRTQHFIAVTTCLPYAQLTVCSLFTVGPSVFFAAYNTNMENREATACSWDHLKKLQASLNTDIYLDKVYTHFCLFKLLQSSIEL